MQLYKKHEVYSTWKLRAPKAKTRADERRPEGSTFTLDNPLHLKG